MRRSSAARRALTQDASEPCGVSTSSPHEGHRGFGSEPRRPRRVVCRRSRPPRRSDVARGRGSLSGDVSSLPGMGSLAPRAGRQEHEPAKSLPSHLPQIRAIREPLSAGAQTWDARQAETRPPARAQERGSSATDGGAGPAEVPWRGHAVRNCAQLCRCGSAGKAAEISLRASIGSGTHRALLVGGCKQC